MKRLLPLIFLFSFNAYSQNEIVLKNEYKPEKIYELNSTIISQNEMSFKGKKESLKKIAANGIKNPIIKTDTQTMQIVNHVGKETNDGKFPMVMEAITKSSYKSELNTPVVTKMYATASQGMAPVIDSISLNSTGDEDYNKQFKEKMQKMMSQLNIQERKIKIGEKFTKETPVNIPVPGSGEIQMGISTTYKLVKIKGDSAIFDIHQVYTMKTNSNNKFTLKASGSGKGKMIFDYRNNYFVDNTITGEMKMSFTVDDIKMNLKSKNITIQRTSLRSD